MLILQEYKPSAWPEIHLETASSTPSQASLGETFKGALMNCIVIQ